MKNQTRAQGADDEAAVVRRQVLAQLKKEIATWLVTADGRGQALPDARMIVVDRHQRALSRFTENGEPRIKLQLPPGTLAGVSYLAPADAALVVADLTAKWPGFGPYRAIDFQEHARQRANELATVADQIEQLVGACPSESDLGEAGPLGDAAPCNDDDTVNDAWREAGAGDDELAMLSNAGGYAAIVTSDKAKSQHQDLLDHCLTSRLFAVRGALREVGWTGPSCGELRKEAGGLTLAFDHRLESVGPGANVVAINYVVFDATASGFYKRGTPLLDLPDRMTHRSTDMVAHFEEALGQALHARGVGIQASLRTPGTCSGLQPP